MSGRDCARLVRVRLDGPADAVALVAGCVARVLAVANQSTDYPNRPPRTGVRRYLDVLIEGGDLVAAGETRL